jgi:LCP family protein required for cell wall assembly
MKTKPRPSPFRRVLGYLGYGLFLLAALGAGVIGNMMTRSSLVGMAFNPLTYLNADPKKTFNDEDGLVLMILGTDEVRKMTGWGVDAKGHQHAITEVTKEGARADMILVAKLDFDHNTITGISIPRDTACKLPGYDTRKITGYHNIAKKGEENALMQQAVEHVLPGVHIDRTIAINYEAFQTLVDTVGGVPVVVPKGKKGNGLQYDDNAGDLHIHLNPGAQTLDGKDAMGYVRFRHDSESDYGRQQRQKEFLTAFKSQIFHNLFKLPEIAEESKQVFGNALNDREIIALVAFARKVPSASIKLGMLPTVERRGTTMLRVDEDKRDDALRQYNLLPATSTAVTP